jgi:hypothetical protein
MCEFLSPETRAARSKLPRCFSSLALFVGAIQRVAPRRLANPSRLIPYVEIANAVRKALTHITRLGMQSCVVVVSQKT